MAISIPLARGTCRHLWEISGAAAKEKLMALGKQDRRREPLR